VHRRVFRVGFCRGDIFWARLSPYSMGHGTEQDVPPSNWEGDMIAFLTVWNHVLRAVTVRHVYFVCDQSPYSMGHGTEQDVPPSSNWEGT
jgi:hypothetical protein